MLAVDSCLLKHSTLIRGRPVHSLYHNLLLWLLKSSKKQIWGLGWIEHHAILSSVGLSNYHLSSKPFIFRVKTRGFWKKKVWGSEFDMVGCIFLRQYDPDWRSEARVISSNWQNHLTFDISNFPSRGEETFYLLNYLASTNATGPWRIPYEIWPDRSRYESTFLLIGFVFIF